MKAPSKPQQGFVIVIVLMIVTLMITLIAFMTEQQHILIRRIGNQNVSEQGYHYAQGVNAWAEHVLQSDKDPIIDYLGEDWAKFGRPEELSSQESDAFSLDLSNAKPDKEELPTIDFGFDGLEFSIDDLQARYNLNNLAVKEPVAAKAQKRIFTNLLSVLEVGEFDERERLYGALVDWIDENDLEVPNGTESGFYSIKKTPYFAADQKLASLGELRFVEGFSREVINKLKPYVTVLPVEHAGININTTSSEVLASLASVTVVDTSSVELFLSARLEEGFLGFGAGDVQNAHNAIIGVSPTRQTPVAGMAQTNSRFFQINVKVTLGEFEYCMKTTVLREPAASNSSGDVKLSVLNRQHDTLCLEESTPIEESDNEDLS